MLVAPRADFAEVQRRAEVRRTGVYVLVGPDEAGDRASRIYVGEGDEVRTRLDAHQTGKEFWTTALVLTSADGSLNKAHVRYLEARLLAIAHEVRTASIDNRTGPPLPRLDEPSVAQMEEFLAMAMPIFSIVGVDAFDVVEAMPGPQPRGEGPARLADHVLRLTSSGCDARGRVDSRGFVVLAGSIGRAETGAMSAGYAALRRRLLDDGVIVADGDRIRFARTHVFGSSSAAADVIVGGSRSGPREWKDVDGRTLKDLQDAEALADLRDAASGDLPTADAE